MERLDMDDHIHWKSTGEDWESNPSTVNVISETANGIEIRVVGSGGGEYTPHLIR